MSKKKNNNLMVSVILAVVMGVSVFVIMTLIEKDKGDKLITEYIKNESSNELKAIDFIIYGFDVSDDGFVFEPANNTIVKYIGDETNVVIPVKINGSRVKVIHANTFYNKNIETLTIPDTVKEIDYEALNGNNIKNVVVYNSEDSNSNESIFVRIPNKLDELEAQIHDNLVVTGEDLKNINDSYRRTDDFERDMRRMIRRLNRIWN